VIERQLALAPAALGIFCGVLSANLTFWLIGRVLGPAAFRLPGLRAAAKGGILEKARLQFDRSGFWAIFISRFLPGTRIPVCTLAGILGMSFPRYFLYSVIAILPWTALLLWIPDRIMELAKWGAIWWLLPGVVVLGGLWWWRRRLVSKEAS
ncbi:MAG: hypothetical protein RL318_3091, partial [Fibrobacterota bacterium]|jgi:membrane protein DedA with SNARE-associated domain